MDQSELQPDEANALPVESNQKHHYAGEIRKYILGGNSCFTVVFGPVVGRRTFKVKSWTKDRNQNWSTGNQDRTKYWVSLKIGRGNGFNDYVNIGRLEEDVNGYMRFVPKLNESSGQMHFAAALFDSLWTPLDNGAGLHPGYEFYHATTCCVCGRALTVPESIESGIGPECAGKE